MVQHGHSLYAKIYNTLFHFQQQQKLRIWLNMDTACMLKFTIPYFTFSSNNNSEYGRTWTNLLGDSASLVTLPENEELLQLTEKKPLQTSK